MGGEISQDWSDSQTDANARGNFVFTGLYAAGGGVIPRGAGFDFADFLLGLPQQASIQYGPGNVKLRGRSYSAYWQDDWRKGPGLTLNLGVRYDLVRPYTEADGQMVNLDATPDFTAVTPVLSGETGPYSGEFPSGLVQTDINNISPKVGIAWRAAPFTIVRAGYGVTYNAGSYSTIARQLVSQPPFANTSTSLGTAVDPLTLSDPFVTATPTTTTNNYGIDESYVLGMIQTWNADLSRDFGYWNLGAGYVGTLGSDLDMLRAPNRGPDGSAAARCAGIHLASGGRPVDSGGRQFPGAPPDRERRRIRRHLHARAVAGQHDGHRRQRHGGPGRSQPGCGMGALELRSPPSVRRGHFRRAAVRPEPAVFERRRALGHAARRLVGECQLHVEFGHAADAARLGRGGRRGARHQRDVACQVQRRAGAARRSDDRSVLQPVGVHASSSGEFGNALRNMIVGPGNRQLNATFSRDVRWAATDRSPCR